MTAAVDLHRQLTAAGMFLDLHPRTMGRAFEVATLYDSLDDPLTPSQAKQLLVWLDAWQERGGRMNNWADDCLAVMGWELTRRSWCPRCDRRSVWVVGGAPAGDPLGHPRHRRRCAVFPPAPLLEIGPGCPNSREAHGTPYAGHMWNGGDTPCAARQLYRWGLRRQATASSAVS